MIIVFLFFYLSAVHILGYKGLLICGQHHILSIVQGESL